MDRRKADLLRDSWITVRAIDVLGDYDKASRWLRQPNRALGGEAPAAILVSEEGARQVDEILGRIELGVYS